jgi:hypothetical protein
MRCFFTVLMLLLLVRLLSGNAYRGAVASSTYPDFSAYYNAAARLSHHEPLYVVKAGEMAYVYSPLLAILLRPVTALPFDSAGKVWAAARIVMLVAACAVFSVALGLKLSEDGVLIGIFLVSAFRLWPTVIELQTANATIPVFLFCSLLFLAVRYDRWYAFAIILAIAILFKTWMAAIIFMLLIRRQYRPLIVCLAATAVGLAMLFTVVGWDQFFVFLDVTRRFAKQDMIPHSIYGFTRLYFSENVNVTPLVNSPVLLWTLRALLYAALVANLAYIWKMGPRLKKSQLPMTLGLVFLAFLLGSSVVHQYYYMLVLPLIWCVWVSAWRQPNLAIFIASVFALVSYLLLAQPSHGIGPIPESLRHAPACLLVEISFYSGVIAWFAGMIALKAPSLKPSEIKDTYPASMLNP